MASALILAAALLLGVSPIMAKVAYAYGVTPLTLLSLRATIGGLAVWLGLAATRRITPLPWTLFVRLLALGLTIVPFQRSEEHTSELQSRENLVCRLLLEKKKKNNITIIIPQTNKLYNTT